VIMDPKMLGFERIPLKLPVWKLSLNGRSEQKNRQKIYAADERPGHSHVVAAQTEAVVVRIGYSVVARNMRYLMF